MEILAHPLKFTPLIIGSIGIIGILDYYFAMMLKKYFLFLILSLPLLSIVSCSKNEDPLNIIWDIYPAEVRIFIQDENGNNLLDPTVEGNLVGTDIRISTEDDSYPAIWNQQDIMPASKLYLANFYGFVWSYALYQYPEMNYYLQLGEYQGEDNYDMHLRLEIPRMNFSREFDYKHTYKWKNNKPDITNQIRYEGKTIKGTDLTIVLPLNYK